MLRAVAQGEESGTSTNRTTLLQERQYVDVLFGCDREEEELTPQQQGHAEAGSTDESLSMSSSHYCEQYSKLSRVKRRRRGPGHTRDTQAITRTHGGHRRTAQAYKPNDTPARPRDSRNPPERRNRGRLNTLYRYRFQRLRTLLNSKLMTFLSSRETSVHVRFSLVQYR